MRCSNGACVQLNSVQEGGVCISSGACKSGLVCRGGVCTLDCGNGVLDAGEQCDDGNTINTDGCTSQCLTNVCGDGIIRSGIEYCDDGNVNARDGCSATCSIESGWSCPTPGVACVRSPLVLEVCSLIGDYNNDGKTTPADAVRFNFHSLFGQLLGTTNYGDDACGGNNQAPCAIGTTGKFICDTGRGLANNANVLCQ